MTEPRLAGGERVDADWSGRRPRVSGIPVFAGLAVAVIAITLLVLSFRRDPGLAAAIAQEYVAMMAGTLTPAVASDNASSLARRLAAEGLAFTPGISQRAADFRLIGGRVHQLDSRRLAVWFYRAPSAELALGAAFTGTLAELGPPDEVRQGPHPALSIFRKSSQTLVFWRDDAVIYGFVATLPGERVIGVSRQLAVSSGSD